MGCSLFARQEEGRELQRCALVCTMCTSHGVKATSKNSAGDGLRGLCYQIIHIHARIWQRTYGTLKRNCRGDLTFSEIGI